MEKSVLDILLQQGVLGAVCVGLAIAYWTERKSHSATANARIEDAKMLNERHTALTERVIVAINKLGELMETWERREHEREMAEIQARRVRVSYPDTDDPTDPPPPPRPRR